MNWKYRFVIIAYLSLFALAFMDNMRGPNLPSLLKDLNLDDRQGALFFAMTSTIAFFSSLYMPRLIAAWGSVKTLAFGLWIIAAAAVAISQSPHFAWILGGTALFGLGYGAISVAMNIAIAEGAPLDWRRRVLSGLHAVYGFASFLSPVVVSLLASSNYGWRYGFTLAAVPGFLIGVYALFLKENKQDVIQPMASTAKDKIQGAHQFWALWMALAVSVYLFGELTLSTRLVLYLVRDEEMALTEASFYLGIFFGTLFFARLLFLFLKIRFSVWRLIQICLSASLVFFALGLTVHPLFLCLCGFTLGPFVPAAIEHQMQLFGRYPTQAVAYTMAFFSLVTVILQFVLGFTTQAFSISVAMWAGPVGLLVSAAMYAWGLKRLKPYEQDLRVTS